MDNITCRKPEDIQREIEELEFDFYFDEGCVFIEASGLQEAEDLKEKLEEAISMIEGEIWEFKNSSEYKALQQEYEQAKKEWAKQTSMFREKP